ncbi:hypothetical protein CEUSTIGMA_g1962.t1 [Chlamydomonas eustigma]|uniref:Membrane-associated protein n=1 Tax=Chlamydomonas eustigma TaxID=1157962 RepID=A0A250WUK5_9CHLO|nr:hypothetical protein CEUSTIGMA_g1962.t1 [Chlamydomonas eustigma]|eukprot:GAX74513.1 hypothetical protein CEUSTIGMA_g1962.t1 [Chlamydomonas eustigma]
MGYVLLVLLFLTSCLIATDATVAMLFSVQRHGARLLLPENPYLNDSDAQGGPALLPQGQRQCYNAGLNYYSRYISNSTCGSSTPSTCLLRWFPSGSTGGNTYGVINTSGVGFNSYNTEIRSSGLDRTIQSAISFSSGIFNEPMNATSTSFLPLDQQVVPVFSDVDSNDDTIRAYTKCPTYDNILSNWYNSTEFLNKSAATQSFRNNIAVQLANFSAAAAAINTSLINWFNVFDAFNVWRTFGLGNPLPDISAADYLTMTDLAYWLEISKMRSTFTGSLLGGVILTQLYQYTLATLSTMLNGRQGGSAQQANATSPGLSYYQLIINSAHYNTQLGLMGAMGLDVYPQAVEALATAYPGGSWLATGIYPSPNGVIPKLPTLAAVMVWELFVPSVIGNGTTPYAWSGDLSELAMRLVIQDGPDKNYTVVPMPCSANGDAAAQLAGPGACTIPNFLTFLESKMYTQAQWCTACANTQVDYCSSLSYQIQLNQTLSTCNSGGGHPTWAVMVAAVVSGVGMAIVCCTAFLLWNYREQLFHKGQRGALVMKGSSKGVQDEEMVPAAAKEHQTSVRKEATGAPVSPHAVNLQI